MYFILPAWSQKQFSDQAYQSKALMMDNMRWCYLIPSWKRLVCVYRGNGNVMPLGTSWQKNTNKKKKVSAEVQDSNFETLALDRTALQLTPASTTQTGREERD